MMGCTSRRISLKTLSNNAKKMSWIVTRPKRNYWTKEQQALFIDSLREGFPIPPVYVTGWGTDKIIILDGVERLNAIFDSVENGEAEDVLDYALEVVDFLDVQPEELEGLSLRYFCKPLSKEELEKVDSDYRK